ncbi:MAG: ribonuclease [Burkholderiales bacterium PBB1]|nr:MAG: ribonuclease [Burkholderiales bacterium PBB1]
MNSSRASTAAEAGSIPSTCDLCDLHKHDSSGSFRVLPPVFNNYGRRTRFAGPISTVKCFEDNTAVKAALEEPGGGRVLVVDGGGSLQRALVGGNIAASAAANGWAGVVVDGCVRDSTELAVTDLGIRALALMPMPTDRKNQGLRDGVLSIQGITVRPGEWLVADEDGIVVLLTPP